MHVLEDYYLILYITLMFICNIIYWYVNKLLFTVKLYDFVTNKTKYKESSRDYAIILFWEAKDFCASLAARDNC